MLQAIGDHHPFCAFFSKVFTACLRTLAVLKGSNLLSISKQIFMVQQELKDLKVAKRRKTQQLSELLIDYNYFNLRFAHVSNLQRLEDKESTQSSPQRSKTTLCDDTEVSIISHNEVTSDDDVLDKVQMLKHFLIYARRCFKPR